MHEFPVPEILIEDDGYLYDTEITIDDTFIYNYSEFIEMFYDGTILKWNYSKQILSKLGEGFKVTDREDYLRYLSHAISYFTYIEDYKKCVKLIKVLDFYRVPIDK